MEEKEEEEKNRHVETLKEASLCEMTISVEDVIFI